MDIRDDGIELNPGDTLTINDETWTANADGSLDGPAMTVEKIQITDISRSNVGLRAYPSADQSISSGSSTKVALDATTNDDKSELDATNHQVEIEDTGRYNLSAIVRFEQDTSWSNEDSIRVSIKLNGSVICRSYGQKTGQGVESMVLPTQRMNLSSGDTVELYVYQNSGATQAIRGHHNVTALNITQEG